MPFSSWFFPPRPKLEVPDGDNDGGSDRPASRSAIDDMDFEAIADKVENLQLELAYAYDLCEQANLQFDKYRVQLQDLKQDLGTERASNAILKDMLSQERKNSAMLKAQFNFANQEVKRQRVLASQLQARLNTETASLNAMTKHARAVENRFVETQFDLEYLKCTTDAEKLSQAPTIQSKDSPIPAQPFVVVLVDGDAYLVSTDQAPARICVLTPRPVVTRYFPERESHARRHSHRAWRSCGDTDQKRSYEIHHGASSINTCYVKGHHTSLLQLRDIRTSNALSAKSTEHCSWLA